VVHNSERYRENSLKTFRVILFMSKQTNERTDEQADGGKNITSLKEVKYA